MQMGAGECLAFSLKLAAAENLPPYFNSEAVWLDAI
jgi:hypothetical protein